MIKKTKRLLLAISTAALFFSAVLMVFCPIAVLADQPATGSGEDSQLGRAVNAAVIVEIEEDFSHDDLLEVNLLAEAAVGEGVKTIIFRFSGRGESFENFSDLAREIDRLATKNGIRTVAYVSSGGATGMTMLAVFACREIFSEKFAQLGEVMSPKTTLLNRKSVEKRIVAFAEVAGHNPLLARAMTNRYAFLYRIGRDGKEKLVDQAGFQKFVTHGNPRWDIIGPGPIVGDREVLLLDGREALELGLVEALVGDEDELAHELGVKIVEVAIPDEMIRAEKESPGKAGHDPNTSVDQVHKKIFSADQSHRAVFITCSEMVDEGLYESIKRRSEAALAQGATYIIYEMDTFGGRIDSAFAIWDYLLHDVGKRAHTVAYVRTKAISAGALISVACRDIIMKSNAQIGDCAPIMMGGKLEGVEREKMESPLRSYFEAAAKTNGYPVALCRAMVTVAVEVYRVKNKRSGKYEYFEKDDLPDNRRVYDLSGKKLVDTKDELFTCDAAKALEYDLARAVVDGLDEEAREEVLAFLEKRDKVEFPRPVETVETNWSEEVVRWLTSPTVAGILFMVALLGIYAELNSPGLGVPGAVAVVALVVLFGSKYLIGMANWWEIAVFGIGMILLLMEIFVIPGFGIAGISGALMMIFALGAMMVDNRPDEWPLPGSPMDWEILQNNLLGLIGGFIGSCFGAYLIGRYFPKIPMANRLILAAPEDSLEARSGGEAAPAVKPSVKVGQNGISLSSLRPSGVARFDNHRVNVVTHGELIDARQKIVVVDIVGNSIVVKAR